NTIPHGKPNDAGASLQSWSFKRTSKCLESVLLDFMTKPCF
ncbi:hypothetical protein NPIL_73291, partial [Nephila pilipes]